MANEPNQLPTPDIEPDTPTPDDGGESGLNLRPATANRLGDDDPGDEPQQKPQEWKDEARAAIAAKAREQRSGFKPYDGNPNTAAVNYGEDEMGDLEKQAMAQQRRHQQGEVDAATGQQPPRQQRQPAQTEQQPDQGDGLEDHAPGLDELDPIFARQKVKIKVDGRETTMTVADAMRHVQLHGAADKRFDTARRMVQEAHALIDHLNPEAQRQQQGQGQQAQRENPFDSPEDDGLDREALIEKIQLGTPKEALEALDKLAASMAQKNSPQDDAYRVLTVLEDRNSLEALNAFAAKHPEVADPDLQMLMARNMQFVMVADLRNAGYSEDWLRANVHDEHQLKALHKKARIDRLPGVRSTSDVLEISFAAARQKATSWTGQPARPSNPGTQPQQQRTTGQPARPMPNRSDRKAGLTAQPPQRGASRQPLPTQQVSIEQSRSNAVERMRKARGQGV